VNVYFGFDGQWARWTISQFELEQTDSAHYDTQVALMEFNDPLVVDHYRTARTDSKRCSAQHVNPQHG
jgi:hypothetical protein